VECAHLALETLFALLAHRILLDGSTGPMGLYQNVDADENARRNEIMR